MASFLTSISRKIEYARNGSLTTPIDKTLHPFIMNPPDTKTMEELIRQAKEYYKITERPYEFHVAVVGAQGVGKSSLINGLRNFADDQPGAALVGKQCTLPTPYKGGFLNVLVFWDFPGAGVGHPEMTYYYDKKLYAFNMILIVSDRFHKVDIEIARAVMRHKHSQVSFVRTKADLAVKREMKQGKHTQITSAMKCVREDVQASFRDVLRIASLSTSYNSFDVFIISTKQYLNPHIYEFYHDENIRDNDDYKMDEDMLLKYLSHVVYKDACRTPSRRYTPILPHYP